MARTRGQAKRKAKGMSKRGDTKPRNNIPKRRSKRVRRGAAIGDEEILEKMDLEDQENILNSSEYKDDESSANEDNDESKAGDTNRGKNDYTIRDEKASKPRNDNTIRDEKASNKKLRQQQVDKEFEEQFPKLSETMEDYYSGGRVDERIHSRLENLEVEQEKRAEKFRQRFKKIDLEDQENILISSEYKDDESSANEDNDESEDNDENKNDDDLVQKSQRRGGEQKQHPKFITRRQQGIPLQTPKLLQSN